jgi:rhodanese-related sulfurtransferase
MHVFEAITPVDYARLREELNPPLLIDVREAWEFAYAHIEGAQLLPLGDLPQWASTLDKNGSYVVMCHHGVRSEYACQLLMRSGFTDVRNLEGGIDAWSRLIDAAVPKY